MQGIEHHKVKACELHGECKGIKADGASETSSDYVWSTRHNNNWKRSTEGMHQDQWQESAVPQVPFCQLFIVSGNLKEHPFQKVLVL